MESLVNGLLSVTEVFASLVACIFCGLCCFNKQSCPLHDFWATIHPLTKIQVLSLCSTIIGLIDTVLDWILIFTWFLTPGDYWIWALIMLINVLLAGFLSMPPKRPLIHLMGLGGVDYAIQILMITKEDVDIEARIRYVKWLMSGVAFSRFLEIVIEAAPNGALQLYTLIRLGDLQPMLKNYDFQKLQFLSLIFSVFSLGYGMEESLGRKLRPHFRCIIWVYATSDFLFRTLSICYVLHLWAPARWIVVQTLWLLEFIFCAYMLRNEKALQTTSWTGLYGALFFMALAVPAVFTSCPILAVRGTRPRASEESLFRFLGSIILSGVAVYLKLPLFECILLAGCGVTTLISGFLIFDADAHDEFDPASVYNYLFAKAKRATARGVNELPRVTSLERENDDFVNYVLEDMAGEMDQREGQRDSLNAPVSGVNVSSLDNGTTDFESQAGETASVNTKRLPENGSGTTAV